MRARIARRSAKVLAANLDEGTATIFGELTKKYGAQFVQTHDFHTPLYSLLGEGGEVCAAEDKYPDFVWQCVVFAGFERDKLNAFLDELKDRKVRIPLKAIYTPHNRGWSMAQLANELAKEYKQMTGGDLNE